MVGRRQGKRCLNKLLRRVLGCCCTALAPLRISHCANPAVQQLTTSLGAVLTWATLCAPRAAPHRDAGSRHGNARPAWSEQPLRRAGTAGLALTAPVRAALAVQTPRPGARCSPDRRPAALAGELCPGRRRSRTRWFALEKVITFL